MKTRTEMFLSATKFQKRTRSSLLINRNKALAISCLLFSIGFFLSSQNCEDEDPENIGNSLGENRADVESSLRPPHLEFDSYKKILYFNNYFHLSDWRFGFGNEPFVSNNCPVTNCYVTADRTLLPSLAQFDAILFHARDMDKRIIQVPNQERRKPNQVYVFFIMESPLNDGLNYTNKRFHNFFNWTMTYRMDSDIARPYGWISEKTKPSFYPSQVTQWLEPRPLHPAERSARTHPKSKMVAWIVSNCNTHSNREDYAELLKKHISVDVFGACGDGKLVCSKEGEHHSQDCTHKLEEDYRFYLSFENSFCSGYVTEKFYKALSLDIIPIVLGAADYKVKAPPKSYINVLDYQSPKELAEFLLKLAADEEEYLSYFWWKRYYHVHSNERERAANAMCKLCEKLNEDPSEAGEKSYPSLAPWWWGEGHCTNKGHVPWAKPKSSWAETVLQYFPRG